MYICLTTCVGFVHVCVVCSGMSQRCTKPKKCICLEVRGGVCISLCFCLSEQERHINIFAYKSQHNPAVTWESHANHVFWSSGTSSPICSPEWADDLRHTVLFCIHVLKSATTWPSQAPVSAHLLLWTELCPPESSCVEALTLNASVVGNTAMKAVIKITWGHMEAAIIQYYLCLYSGQHELQNFQRK